MSLIDSASPTVQSRDQDPPTGSESIAGQIDLADVAPWGFLSSFAFPTPDHLEFTYNPGSVTLDISGGRVARQDDRNQTILKVDPVSGLGLKGGTVNYIFLTGSDVIESRDQDNPPDGQTLLLGTVDPRDGTTDTDVRGRSPISQFLFDTTISAAGASGEGRTTVDAVDLADGANAFHREYIGSGLVLRLQLVGVMDDSLSQTSGLAARVVDEGDGSVYASTEQKRDSRSPPIKIYGPADLRFEANNASGASVTEASARFEYDVVPGSAPALAVDTVESKNVTDTTADLVGDLRSLGTASSVDVSHKYRQQGTSSFTQVGVSAVSSPQQFTDSVSGLSAGTTYEFKSFANDGSVTDDGALQTFKTAGSTLITSFEGVTVSDEFNGDTGQFAVGSTHATDGVESLEVTPSGTAFARIYSLPGDGLTNYYDPAQTLLVDVRPEGTDKLTFGAGYATGLSSNGNVNGYEIDIDILGDVVRLNRVDDGSRTLLADQSTSGFDAEKWHLIDLGPIDGGTHDITVRNLATDTNIASLSATDSTYNTNEGIHVFNDPDNATKAYWDHWRQT